MALRMPFLALRQTYWKWFEEHCRGLRTRKHSNGGDRQVFFLKKKNQDTHSAFFVMCTTFIFPRSSF